MKNLILLNLLINFLATSAYSQLCTKTEFMPKYLFPEIRPLMDKLDYCSTKNSKTFVQGGEEETINNQKIYRIKYSHPSVNKGRPVYLFIPKNANLKKLSINAYFHGDNFNHEYGLRLNKSNSSALGKKISSELNKNPNQVFIVPIANYNSGFTDRAELDEPQGLSKIISSSMTLLSDWRFDQKSKFRCINPNNSAILSNYKMGNPNNNNPINIKHITLNFHSAGGWALDNIIKNNDLVTDKINLFDANFPQKYHPKPPLEVLMNYCSLTTHFFSPACKKENIGVWYTDYYCHLSRPSIIKYQNNITPFYFNKGGSPHDGVPIEHLGAASHLNSLTPIKPVQKCK